jgi:hypothetical protein
MAKETCASRMAGTGSLLPTFKRYIIVQQRFAVSAIILRLALKYIFIKIPFICSSTVL